MANGDKDPVQAFRDGFESLIDTGIGHGSLTDEQGLMIDLTHQHLLTNGLSRQEAAEKIGILVAGAIRGNAYMREREWGVGDA